MTEKILEEYTNSSTSIEKLALKYKIGKLKVKKILLENNVPLKKKGGQIKYNVKDVTIDHTDKSIECKKCKKVYNDVENKSGGITNHIKLCFNDVNIPSKLFRSNYKKTNGVYWHFMFFNLINKKIENKLECPECGWSTKDLNNKTGAFTKHIMNNHDDIDSFIKKHPKFKKLFNPFMSEINLDNYFKENNENYVNCLICDKPFKTITNTHLETHGLNIEEYLIKYNNPPLVSNTHKKIYCENLTNVDSSNLKYRSVGEIEICEFLNNNNIEHEICNKKILSGTELDIYVPKHNIAIEFNGLYWHSEKQGKNKQYHINKTKKCLEKNIRLIHIFSDEWETKKEIIKKRLKYLFKTQEEKIYARKCEIVEITQEEKSAFLNANHLQGNDKSNIFIGLKYKNEIVSVITFGKLRRLMGNKISHNNHYELYRFASKNVIGGFSKLFKYFIKKYEPDTVITYADIKWTPSDEFSFYSKVGFDFISETKPNYYYTRNYTKREHRYNYAKNKLIKMGYDKNKSETQIMFENGYDRIWDCGNLKYVYNKKREQ